MKSITISNEQLHFYYPAAIDLHSQSAKVPSVITVVDNRNILQRIKSVLISFFKLIIFLIRKKVKNIFVRRIRNDTCQTYIKPLKSSEKYAIDQLPWNKQETVKTNNDALFVCVHGLRISPYMWKRYLSKIADSHPNAYCIAPHVPFKGECSLEVSANPILEVVQNYADSHPGKPIILIGASNGSRIAMYIENNLSLNATNESPPRKILIASVAGVHNGTKQINFLARWRLLWIKKFHRAIQQDFHWESQVAQTNLKNWQRKQKEWKKHSVEARHFFCASKDDEQVRPISASLPHTLSDVTYKIFTSENHLSIVYAACDDVLGWVAKNLKN